MSKVFEEAKRFILGLADKSAHEKAVKEDAVRKLISSADNHKPGSTRRLSDGTTYVVQSSGAWKRVLKSDAKFKRDQRSHRVIV